MDKFWKLVILVGIFILIGLIDLGLNAIGIFFPSFGAVVESLGEVVLEIMQTVVFGIGLIVAGGDD